MTSPPDDLFIIIIYINTIITEYKIKQVNKIFIKYLSILLKITKITGNNELPCQKLLRAIAVVPKKIMAN